MDADNEWESLIEKHADGMPICNCRQAYYSMDGEAYIVGMGLVCGLPHCKYGCSANQIRAKRYIANRVIMDYAPPPNLIT